MDEGWDTKPEQSVEDLTAQQRQVDAFTAAPITDEDALRCSSVTEVAHILRSAYLRTMFQGLQNYEEAGNDGTPKNFVTAEETKYVSECSNLVLRIEADKSRVMVFLRAHYGLRFPELAMFISDFVLYAKVIKIIQNSVDLAPLVEQLDELLPSQMLVVIICCASTTNGRELSKEELRTVLDACEELENLEMAKQTFLEYIQCSMPLICPNLCALLNTGITSQMFGLAGSVEKIAQMDDEMIIRLGSQRKNTSGIAVHTTGFLSNCDLISNLPAPLRPKALRLLAGSTLKLARIDAGRAHPSKDQGEEERRRCFARIRQWLDPPATRGAGNILYERRGRKRRRER